MTDGGAVRAKSCAGQCPPVVGGGEEVGWGVKRARAVGEEERNWGKSVIPRSEKEGTKPLYV
jgi:hypothetical protein